jgi:alanine-glyoxylate transaminase/serine-glyoxylate transaminase/serine-pyruvate transaminase
MGLPVVGHLDPEFLHLLDQTQDLLRFLFQTANRMTLAISGTGMAGMETVVVNLIEPGDPVLVCINGFFGARMQDVAERAGARVTVFERPYGEAFDPDSVKAAIQRTQPKVVGIVQAETSTGAWQPIEEIARIAHEAGALIVVDSVTALGGIPVEIDAWEVDAVYSVTQKCVGGPPGLSPVSLGPRAVEVLKRRRHKVQSWYLDLTLIERYWGSDRFYHHTTPISMVYALREALALVVEEGLQARFDRHALHGRALRAGLAAMDLKLVTDANHRLPQLTCVRIPDGIDDLAVRRRLLADWGIEIGGGLGPLKGQAWRVGLMGHSARKSSVTLFLAALETCLRDLRYRVPSGEAIRAAAAVYAEASPSAGPQG